MRDKFKWSYLYLLSLLYFVLIHHEQRAMKDVKG